MGPEASRTADALTALVTLLSAPHYSSNPGNTVTSYPHGFLREQPLPRLLCPNRCRVFVQSPAFFLARQACKFLMQRIISRDESFLPMEDRGRLCRPIIKVADLQGPQMHD